MPDARRTPSTITIEIASSPADFAAGAELIAAYRKEFYEVLCLQNIDQELLELELRYSPPDSRFFLLKEAEKIVGCAILKRLSEEAVELKRMYLQAEARGRGYSKLLLQHCIQTARDLGFRRMLLDTEPVMATAIQLYERFGFQRCEPYYNSPLPNGLFYELVL
jgi:GNAT superfamily N-acetyltransferase